MMTQIYRANLPCSNQPKKTTLNPTNILMSCDMFSHISQKLDSIIGSQQRIQYISPSYPLCCALLCKVSDFPLQLKLASKLPPVVPCYATCPFPHFQPKLTSKLPTLVLFAQCFKNISDFRCSSAALSEEVHHFGAFASLLDLLSQSLILTMSILSP